MIPAVVPAIGMTLMFEPELERRVVVRGVDVDHEEPDELCDDEELLCDEVLDDREVL